MFLLRVVWLTIGALAAWPAAGRAQQIRDSSGVRLVTYSRTAAPRATWHLSPRPILELGASHDTTTEFSAVRGVVRLASGQLAVANGGSNQIRLFTRDGRFVRALGRTGSAEVTLPSRFVPYEFGRDHVAGVAFDADDVERVVVWELRRAGGAVNVDHAARPRAIVAPDDRPVGVHRMSPGGRA